MEIIRRGEQFYKTFRLTNTTYDELRQIIIKCYSDVNPENNIVFIRNLRPLEYPDAIQITRDPDYEDRITCLFSKSFTKDMTLGLWKVEALLQTEAGYDGDIYKPLGDLFNVLPTIIE